MQVITTAIRMEASTQIRIPAVEWRAHRKCIPSIRFGENEKKNTEEEPKGNQVLSSAYDPKDND